jgi:hypothetical protein
MATDYSQERFTIPILEGDNETRFETATGLHIATGYIRIVIGGRGPYIEFNPDQVVLDNLHIPEDKKWKLNPKLRQRYPIDYFDWRTNDKANVKFYDQLKTVDYADYKIGMMYAGPFKLYVNGKVIIENLRDKKNDDVQYLF